MAYRGTRFCPKDGNVPAADCYAWCHLSFCWHRYPSEYSGLGGNCSIQSSGLVIAFYFPEQPCPMRSWMSKSFNSTRYLGRMEQCCRNSLAQANAGPLRKVVLAIGAIRGWLQPSCSCLILDLEAEICSALASLKNSRGSTLPARTLEVFFRDSTEAGV